MVFLLEFGSAAVVRLSAAVAEPSVRELELLLATTATPEAELGKEKRLVCPIRIELLLDSPAVFKA